MATHISSPRVELRSLNSELLIEKWSSPRLLFCTRVLHDSHFRSLYSGLLNDCWVSHRLLYMVQRSLPRSRNQMLLAFANWLNGLFCAAKRKNTNENSSLILVCFEKVAFFPTPVKVWLEYSATLIQMRVRLISVLMRKGSTSVWLQPRSFNCALFEFVIRSLPLIVTFQNSCGLAAVTPHVHLQWRRWVHDSICSETGTDGVPESNWNRVAQSARHKLTFVSSWLTIEFWKKKKQVETHKCSRWRIFHQVGFKIVYVRFSSNWGDVITWSFSIHEMFERFYLTIILTCTLTSKELLWLWKLFFNILLTKFPLRKNIYSLS